MSYIVRVGNLASTPELRTAENGRVYCYADVIVNDRERTEDGAYRDLGTIRYSLTVFRSAAEQLVETAQTSGNVRVLFRGSYRVREYDRRDGGTGISHDVMVDEIGVSLTGQRVRRRPAPARRGRGRTHRVAPAGRGRVSATTAAPASPSPLPE